jgi:hypothetical protein
VVGAEIVAVDHRGILKVTRWRAARKPPPIEGGEAVGGTNRGRHGTEVDNWISAC